MTAPELMEIAAWLVDEAGYPYDLGHAPEPPAVLARAIEAHVAGRQAE